MTRCEVSFPEAIPHHQVFDTALVEKSPQPEGITVAVEDHVQVDGNRLLLRAWVTNPHANSVQVMVWPVGGTLPYGGDNPLTLRLSPESDLSSKYVGEVYPPEPPPFMELTLPARCRTRFTAEFDLSGYQYTGSPEVALEWTFHWGQGPNPHGQIVVRLPQK